MQIFGLPCSEQATCRKTHPIRVDRARLAITIKSYWTLYKYELQGTCSCLFGIHLASIEKNEKGTCCLLDRVIMYETKEDD